MATFTVDGAIARLRRLPGKLGDRAKVIMQEEINKTTHKNSYGPSGLADSVTVRHGAWLDFVSVGPEKYVGGGKYKRYSLGTIVREGRPELWAKHNTKDGRPGFLKWEDMNGVHYARHVGPAEPNDFIQRTKDRLLEEIRSGEIGL